MKINEIRKQSGLSRAEFSRRYNIPVRTLEDWESEKRKCPEYVSELLERVVSEDNTNIYLKCYSKSILKEIGNLYRKLLFVLNDNGHNPYPNCEVFPTKYFTMVFHQAMRIGIPDTLEKQISDLFNSIDAEDWGKSMNIPLPLNLRQYFLLSLEGYAGD